MKRSLRLVRLNGGRKLIGGTVNLKCSFVRSLVARDFAAAGGSSSHTRESAEVWKPKVIGARAWTRFVSN